MTVVSAKTLFPDEEERLEIKRILEMFGGTIVKVEGVDGFLLFP